MQYLLPDGASDRFIRINGFDKNVQKYALEMENPFVTTVTELNEGETYENFTM